MELASLALLACSDGCEATSIVNKRFRIKKMWIFDSELYLPLPFTSKLSALYESVSHEHKVLDVCCECSSESNLDFNMKNGH